MLPWEELTCWMHILHAVSFPSGPVAGIWYFSGIFCLLQWSMHGFFTSMTVRPRESQHRKYSNFANFRVWLLKACFKLEQQEVGVGQQLLASPPHHHKNLFEFTRVQMFVSTKSPIGRSRRNIAIIELCARTSKLICSDCENCASCSFVSNWIQFWHGTNKEKKLVKCSCEVDLFT